MRDRPDRLEQREDNQEARQKAQQLTQKFKAAGLPVPADQDILVRSLGTDGNETASLRLTIPPLVTFLTGALLTMATVDLAMGETVTGASRFVAGLLQLGLLAIGIVVGAELVGNPHTGPVAGSAASTIGAWGPWVGVALFGLGVYVHNSAPRRSMPWLLIVCSRRGSASSPASTSSTPR